MADQFEIIAAIIDAAGPAPTAEDILTELAAVSERAPVARKKPKPAASSGRPPGPSPEPPLPPAAAPALAAPPPLSNFAGEPSQAGGSEADDTVEGRGGDDLKQTEEGPDELNRRCAWFPQTDLGNVERFVARNRGRFIFCNSIGWLWWDGRRWSREGADQRVIRAEHETVRAIQEEAKAIAALAATASGGKREDLIDLADSLYGHGRKSEGVSKMASIHKRATADLTIETAQLDADPFMINIRNGTIVVRREWTAADGNFKRWPSHGDYIRLKPHSPSDLITKLAPVTFDPKAPRAQFDAFINDVQPDPAMRRFLQQWKGYSLTGDASEHRMALFLGSGRNGKSVFEDATAHVAGDYAETVPIETFLATGREANANAPSPARALLHNARMVRTSEPNKGVKLDEGFIKLVTGGEPIQARNLNLPMFRFYPILKLTVQGNHKPKITGTDEGIWSRITRVPWEVFIPPEKRDRKLTEKLRAESSGILSWMLDGLSDWMETGLILPDKVKEATAEYRRDSDQLGQFLEMCTKAEDDARVQSSVFLAVFNAWARMNGGSEWTGRGLANAMSERGFKKDKSSVMFWLGIKLTKGESDFADGSGRQQGGGGGGNGGLSEADVEEMAF